MFDKKISDCQEECIFTEHNIRLYQMLDGYKNQDITTDALHIYKDKMVLGEYAFPFAEISAMSMLYGNILLFTHGDTYFGLTGDNFRAWKCGRLWHLAKGDTDDKTKEL